MKIFKISQDSHKGRNTYDSAIVASSSQEEAKTIHPSNDSANDSDKSGVFRGHGTCIWCRHVDDVIAEYIGEAVPGTLRGVICASFNAG